MGTSTKGPNIWFPGIPRHPPTWEIIQKVPRGFGVSFQLSRPSAYGNEGRERERERRHSQSRARKERYLCDVRKTYIFWNPLWPIHLSLFRDDVLYVMELTQPPFLMLSLQVTSYIKIPSKRVWHFWASAA